MSIYLRHDSGATIRLEPEESFRDIYGSENLMRMAVMFQWPEYERGMGYTLNQWHHYEDESFIHQITLSNAIKALDDREMTHLREKAWNESIEEWVWPWDPLGPDQRHRRTRQPACHWCYRPMTRIIFCYS